MSKERSRRRAAREREAAMRAHARARQQERRERQARRRRVLRGATSDRLRVRPGRPGGVLARRQRLQNRALTAALLFLVAVVWVVRPDWPARLAIVVLCILAWPVLRLLLFSRR